MPSLSKKSYGSEVQARVKYLLQVLLEGVAEERELKRDVDLKWSWSEDDKTLTLETTLRSLVLLAYPDLATNTDEFKSAKSKARESLIDLRDYVGILNDHRIQKRGSEKWHFSLRLWGQDIQRNLAEFDKLWESKRSPASKPKLVPETQTKFPLKPGAPFPKVRLPDNFVPRPNALKAVKEKLLAEDDRTLVVSAIAGLGGLGKSVLATALVLDPEVQARFADGMLWVTVGQKPDLQTLLGDWIRELDKSRESFSATTLESASSYLHNLLVERQMLLVVDDVWNAAHAEWFRVGGAGCRVLVTTREAQIEGADYHQLDLMSEAEAIDLVQKKLGRQWRSEQEAEVKAFAKVLGYLPLALDLAANQVRDGLSWEELRSEFEAERRSVALGTGRRSSALKLLDSCEKWDDLDENQQRKYSLQACFNLSLKRLNPEQLQQFAWLGVLPEDVNLNKQIASVLWDVSLVIAKRALVLLRNRSFLIEGGATIEDEPTYRVHDLMHDMARSLVEEGILQSVTQIADRKLQNLALAHQQFLERYRTCAVDARWDRLPNDSYIYRHLTWHMEQADWVDEVHALMAMSDAQGRNAWFEACDRIGQPAIFIEDVARGWRLAEQGYEQDRTGAIVLQCRYALITATLNSLLENLPTDMMAEFVKREFWTVDQAWAYVEQMQNETKIAEAIQVLALNLSKALFQVAVGKARVIQSESSRAWVLRELAKLDAAYFSEALDAARAIQSESSRAEVLSELAKLDAADFFALLDAARAIQSESSRAKVLRELAKLDTAYFSEALDAARAIQNESSRARVLSELAKLDAAYFSEALDAARAIQNESSRARVLSELAKLDAADFSALLDAARAIQDESSRARVLSELAKLDAAYFSEALDAARVIQDESSRAEVLSELAKLDAAYFSEALDAARVIQDESSRAEVLSELAKLDTADFSALLDAARAIQDEYSRAWVLRELAKLDAAYFSEALDAARAIQNESSRARVLSELAKLDAADFSALLDAARAIQDESSRARVLSELAKLDAADFSALLDAARAIQDESSRARVLSELAKLDTADFSALLDAARVIQDESSRAKVLSELAKLDAAYFSEALDAAWVIQDESSRAEVLSELAKLDAAYFSEALDAARAIQDESNRAEVLRELAKLDAADFSALLDAARAIQDESNRAEVLRELAKLDAADFSALLDAARAIQDESSRAEVLRELAKLDAVDFSALLDAARAIQDEYSRAEVLSELAKLDAAYFSEALDAARVIQSEYSRAEVLSELAKLDAAYFSEALDAARAIQNESSRAWVLRELAKLDTADFSALLDAARAIQSESSRAEVLRELAKLDAAYFSEALDAARAIQDESSRAEVLSELAKLDAAYFSEALDAARVIQDESSRARVLRELAKLDAADFFALLDAARAIQDESSRAWVLRELAKLDAAYFSEALDAARVIQDESSRAGVLSELAKLTSQDSLPRIWEAMLCLSHKPTRARSLSSSLSHFSLSTLPLSNWQAYLHLLATRRRPDLMQDLSTLHPAIVHLGGEAAMPGVVRAMREVCEQWK
jgi:hypothetical protein